MFWASWGPRIFWDSWVACGLVVCLWHVWGSLGLLQFVGFLDPFESFGALGLLFASLVSGLLVTPMSWDLQVFK